MATTITLDPRFPVPDSMDTTDPSHPLQLVRSGIEVQNQAAADSKYDLQTPERFKRGAKEGFSNPFAGIGDILLAVVLLVFVGFIWMAVGNTTKPLYTFVLLIGFAVLFLACRRAFD